MKHLFVIAFVFSAIVSISQEIPVIATSDKEDVEIFTIVEEMPQFPGGQDELFKFLASNIKYPEEAQKAGISGVVYANFVVDDDGSVIDVKIIRGIGGGCDEETLRVVSLMPKWEPGIQRGKRVKVSYNLPVRYTLNLTKKQKKALEKKKKKQAQTDRQ